MLQFKTLWHMLLSFGKLLTLRKSARKLRTRELVANISLSTLCSQVNILDRIDKISSESFRLSTTQRNSVKIIKTITLTSYQKKNISIKKIKIFALSMASLVTMWSTAFITLILREYHFTIRLLRHSYFKIKNSPGPTQKLSQHMLLTIVILSSKLKIQKTNLNQQLSSQKTKRAFSKVQEFRIRACYFLAWDKHFPDQKSY